MQQLPQPVQKQLEKLITAMGYELLGYEWLPQGRFSVLRIYLDGPGGITLEDCSRVSGQVSAWLDVADPVRGKYSLEVSSPGIDRPLFTPAHYQKFVGHWLKIRLRMPVADQRNFIGMLQQVNEEDICLMVEGQPVILPFANIEKANIYPEK